VRRSIRAHQPGIGTRGDGVVLVASLGLVGTLLLSGPETGSQATRAEIKSIATHETHRVSLDGTRTLSVEGRLGTTEIEIGPGRIRFSVSPCERRYCIHAGWLDHGGAFMACAPNGVTITVHGTETTPWDALTY